MYNSLYQQFRIAAKCRGSQWQIYLLLAVFALWDRRNAYQPQTEAALAADSLHSRRVCGLHAKRPPYVNPYYTSASASASISAICCSFSEDLIVTFCSSTVRFLHFSSIAPI